MVEFGQVSGKKMARLKRWAVVGDSNGGKWNSKDERRVQGPFYLFWGNCPGYPIVEAGITCLNAIYWVSPISPGHFFQNRLRACLKLPNVFVLNTFLNFLNLK